MTQSEYSSQSFAHIETLNHHCACIPLPQLTVDQLAAASSRHASDASSAAAGNIPFAATPVFVSSSDYRQMTQTIEAVTALTRLPAFRQHCRYRAADHQAADEHTIGVVSGFDFHLSAEGPKLIEINTNAGGAFLANAMIRRHNQTLAAHLRAAAATAFGHADAIEQSLLKLFRTEWTLAARGGQQLRHIAIVDDDPASQFLYADMLLARQLLEQLPCKVSIVASSALAYRQRQLRANDQPIDFVYNRLTDFSLQAPANRALRHAWLDNAVVVSPSPVHHNSLANKHNMVLFSDRHRLRAFGLAARHISLLNKVPDTIHLNCSNRYQLWSQRKSRYFKPVAGHAGKAVYRGSKITRRVWQSISHGTHIAQQQIHPTLRYIEHGGQRTPRKFDIRVYTYGEQPIATIARLYQGQTTNFTTPGGGLAPVLILPDPACEIAAKSC